MVCRIVVLFLFLGLPSFADESAGMSDVLAKVAPSIATVKVVTQSDFTMGGQSQSSESRTEVQGVVVDEGGLVMISNATFDTSSMKDLLSGAGQGGVDIKITPTEFKVVIEQEEEEHEAFLAATDTKLGLAFVQIADLGDRKLAAVSFEGGADLAVGQRLLAVGRLKKGYDYAPYVVSAHVTGKIGKPRTAWLVDGDMAGAALPAFTEAGALVGIVGDVQAASEEDGGGDREGRMLRRLLGRMNRAEPAAPSFLLPPGPVKASIEAAKKQAADLAKERAEKKDEPKEEEAPKDGEEPKDEAPEDGEKEGK